MLEILLNDDLAWSRGKRSAHAVHAFLAYHKVRYLHAVVVLNAKPRDIASAESGVVLDASGRPAAVARRVRGALQVGVHVRKSDTRDDTARLAVLSAAEFYGVPVGEFRVVSSSEREVRCCRIHISDAGRTELEPGTLTSAARDA